MGLNYNFDVYSVAQKSVCTPLKLGNSQNSVGTNDVVTGETIAIFRDPKTVAALQASCPRVIKAFRNAGFGCNLLDSAPSVQHVPLDDKSGRSVYIKKLTKALNAEFTSKERKVEKILDAPVNRPTTMLDRLNGIVPKTEFVVNAFINATPVGDKARATQTTHRSVQNGGTAKLWERNWSLGFVTSVLRH